MPTTKRERHRAGCAACLAALEAQRRSRRRRRNAIVGGVLAIIALGLIYLVSRPSNKKVVATAPKCVLPKMTATRQTTFTKAPAMTLCTSDHYSAFFQTDVGNFTVSLDAATAPKTVNDFVYLADHRFYDGLTFHRVIPGFVVQGGDPDPPTSADPNPSGAQGPGYTVQGEVPATGKPTYPLGSLAMAKTSAQPNGASESQFFVVVGAEGEDLPPQYSLFGQVTQGMSVVDRIVKDGTASGTPTKVHHMISVTIAASAASATSGSTSTTAASTSTTAKSTTTTATRSTSTTAK